MNFRTFEDLTRIISNNIYKIPSDVDLIVGIPKSGLMAASIISLHLNLPLTDIDSFLEDKIYTSGTTKVREDWIKKVSDARKILIVDDSIITGKTYKSNIEKLKKSKYKKKIITLVVIATEETKDIPDIYFDICPSPRLFEWNYMHHPLLGSACVDIDGVLCQDPTEEENDDGEKYINFISNVKPRVVPTQEIGYLVTTRLEKYRKYTEKWLKKNNIKYRELIMLNLESKEERIKLGNHGQYKGEEYLKLPNTLIFIESSEHQAPIIANTSGKPVFCVDNGKLYLPTTTKTVTKKERKIRNLIRRYIPLEFRKKLKKIVKK